MAHFNCKCTLIYARITGSYDPELYLRAYWYDLCQKLIQHTVLILTVLPQINHLPHTASFFLVLRIHIQAVLQITPFYPKRDFLLKLPSWSGHLHSACWALCTNSLTTVNTLNMVFSHLFAYNSSKNCCFDKLCTKPHEGNLSHIWVI